MCREKISILMVYMVYSDGAVHRTPHLFRRKESVEPFIEKEIRENFRNEYGDELTEEQTKELNDLLDEMRKAMREEGRWLDTWGDVFYDFDELEFEDPEDLEALDV